MYGGATIGKSIILGTVGYYKFENICPKRCDFCVETVFFVIKHFGRHMYQAL
jgi:hypothetical protein